MDLSTLTYATGDGVARIVLNRPGQLNAISPELLADLDRACEAIEGDSEVRAVTLTAAGRAFCAGADLRAVQATVGDPERWAAFMRLWHRVFDRIEALPVPVVAGVHGLALAGGLELVLVADLVVMDETARLGDQHANFGLFPGGGSTQRLPRLIGRRAATWMLLSGNPVDAPTALNLGLANRVAPDNDVLEVARDMARELAERSSAASRAIKRSLREGIDLPLGDALDVERGIAVEHMASTDAAAGLAAFAGRTRPDFGYRRPVEAAER